MSHPVSNVAPLELGFAVSNLEASLDFWRDALGFQEISRIETPDEFARKSGIAPGAYTVVRLKLPTGERVKLFQLDQAAERGVAPTTPLSTSGFAFLTLIVADIATALEHLRSSGGRVRAEVVRLRANVRTALIDDPDGITVELVEYDDLGAYRSNSEKTAC